MMMKAAKLLKIFLITGLLGAVSCKEESVENPVPDNLAASNEAEFTLEIPVRAIPGDDSYLDNLSDYFEHGLSKVLISQRTGSLSLNFEEENSNCYAYTYYKNESADWENLYNFQSDTPLSWERIISNGQYGNGYGFGALFFPRGYKYLDRISHDQSDEGAHYQSDVLGAWHRTSVEYDRLRFRLNHLMCRLHINLYIPDLDEDSKGFPKEAVTAATTINFRTDYAIEWGDRSSENPPMASPSAAVEGERHDIIMYPSPSQSSDVIENFPLANYHTEVENDNVRLYTFDVFFPEQTVNGNFLRFTLTKGGVEYNYVFSSAYLTGGAPFAFHGGDVTQLELYLPRTSNDFLLLGANIIKWNESYASFTITKEEKDNQ